MKRKCKLLKENRITCKAIYIDVENSAEILKYIKQDNRHKKKFWHIVDLILDGHKNRDLYDKEDINDKCKDVTAMKILKGQENDRLYCKEIHGQHGTHIIIASELHQKKKSTKLTEVEINIITKVANYDYEIQG